ncbi:UDP-2,4-diacetamido-2,4,6-trideoxy-beta-L-altropyranose hydrolase [Mahella australiensis]|uniref:Pseudaminic acid biosynthesis-associated protein PseG n=1 Tax=Mahella australiensis (strain DSM 15567 / CIP 107919 / 50-1 BON) TaxID=697281 RepID=F3ZYZ2_MAHA5|nr:UDP-2,4-diacetamido-2,4,6-trideoxy-beta-L-altropyranose hydrolase [Mahella australiensis]AEE96751.1 pseudaminic acid biosynthesis-associated protein PseG [Mahella australiensis 50-1 BON]
MNIAIRADGGYNIGMGHIMRCMALAQALRDKGCNVCFITRHDSSVEAVLKMRLGSGINVIPIESHDALNNELEQLSKIIHQYAIDALVVDHYGADQAYLIETKKMVDELLTIDDLNCFTFPSDIVINGNIYAPDMEYRSLYGNTKFLLGPQYLLMRQEFRNLPKRCVNDNVERILITMGGSDLMGLTAKILRALRGIGGDIAIDVVMGAASNDKDAVEMEVSRTSNVNLLYDVDDMAELMFKADLAISAAGSTLYELAACGVPAITLIQADNQVAGAEGMAKAGCAVNLGWGDRADLADMKHVIKMLTEDKIKRQCMADIGQSIVDGLGAMRCVKIIMG